MDSDPKGDTLAGRLHKKEHCAAGHGAGTTISAMVLSQTERLVGHGDRAFAGVGDTLPREYRVY